MQQKSLPKLLHSQYHQIILTSDTVSAFNEEFNRWFTLSDKDVASVHNESEHINNIIAAMHRNLGKWYMRSDEDLKDASPRIVGFYSFDNTVSEFYSSILFSIFAASSLREAGFHTGSRNELYIVLDTLNRYMKWIRVYELSYTCEDNISFCTAFYTPFVKNLIFLSQHILSILSSWEEMDNEDCVYIDLISNEKTDNDDCDDSSSNRVKYFAKFKAYAANTYLSIDALEVIFQDQGDFNKKAKEIEDSYLSDFEKNLGDECFGENDDAKNVCGRKTLYYLITRHKYPALRNMHMLKNLLDDTILTALSGSTDNAVNTAMRVKAWSEELYDMEKRFDSPMLFTPSMLAETSYLIWRYCKKCKADKAYVAAKKMKTMDHYQHLAYTQTLRAEQMFTQGHEYYKNISGMYYLFDDFNDRTLHINHAQQMAGADLLALFKRELKNRCNI